MARPVPGGPVAEPPAVGTAPGASRVDGRFPLLAPLRGRDFAFLWGGTAVSLAGDQLQTVALAIFALERTGSPALLGAVLTVQAVPRALLMLAGGVLADRYRPRTLLLATNAVQAVLVAAMALLLAADRLALWHLFLYAGASGVVYAAAVPAAATLVPQLVPPERLRAANALTSLNVNLATAVYPPLAGLLVAGAGSAPAFALDAASFVVAAVAVGLIRAPRAPALPGGGAVGQVRAGVAAARADPVVWTAIVAATGYSLGATGATFVGVPALATLTLEGGSAGVGVLSGAVGAGAVAGALGMGALTRLRRPGLWGGLALLGLGLALASVAVAPTLAWAAVPLAVAGLLRAACANLYVTLVQTRAPAAVRGRVMSLFMLGVLGLLPLSTALSGLLGGVLGPRALFVGGGLIVTGAGAYALSRRPFREAS